MYLKLERFYNSTVTIHELELDEEYKLEGDLVAEGQNYHTILAFGEFIRNQHGVAEIFNIKTPKNAWGMREDKSMVFVTVEQDEDSEGVTMKQLANILLELGCINGEYTELVYLPETEDLGEVIGELEYSEDAVELPEEVHEDDMIMDGSAQLKYQSNKRKRK
jgi:hypothetical protein